MGRGGDARRQITSFPTADRKDAVLADGSRNLAHARAARCGAHADRQRAYSFVSSGRHRPRLVGLAHRRRFRSHGAKISRPRLARDHGKHALACAGRAAHQGNDRPPSENCSVRRGCLLPRRSRPRRQHAVALVAGRIAAFRHRCRFRRSRSCPLRHAALECNRAVAASARLSARNSLPSSAPASQRRRAPHAFSNESRPRGVGRRGLDFAGGAALSGRRAQKP